MEFREITAYGVDFSLLILDFSSYASASLAFCSCLGKAQRIKVRLFIHLMGDKNPPIARSSICDNSDSRWSSEISPS